MSDIFLLFSHKLTPEQERDLRENWKVENMFTLPDHLQKLWSKIPPDLPNLSPHLEPIKSWLKEKGQKGDLVLIQADFGAVYLMVNYAFELGLIPIYATTERAAREKVSSEGEVIINRVFRHKIFRVYGR